jgi:predicted NBD/HSP70 family sugar kinase
LPDLSAVVSAALDASSDAHSSALKVMKVAAGVVGKSIGPALTLLNVQRVIVGGLVGRELYPLLVDDLKHGLESTALPAARRGFSLEKGVLGGTASVRGAAVAGFDAHGVDFLLSVAERSLYLAATA